MTHWLASIGLAEYAAAFIKNHITYETLELLADEDLKECGITAVGHRRKLQLEIRKLMSGAAEAPEPPPSTAIHPPPPAAATPAPHPLVVAPAPPPPAPQLLVATPAAPAPARVTEVPIQPAMTVALQRAPLKTGQPVPVIPDHPEAVPPVPGAIQTDGRFLEETMGKIDRQEALVRRQRRQSFIASLAIAVLSVFLIGLILAFILIAPLFKDTPTIVTYSGSTNKEEQLEQSKMTNQIQRKPSAPSSSLAKVIAANTASPIAIPVPDVDVPTPSADFGSGDDFGDGWGSGGDGGGGGGFGTIPATMRKRCSQQDRMQRLQQHGGTEQCEQAVVKGLDWLKATQGPDGGWGQAHRSAMTGFALLAYLGHCETPLSEKYSETVLRGLTFLINLGMQNNGKLIPQGGEGDRTWPYDHSIATYALAEATTFCKQLGVTVPNLPEITQRAGQLIIDSQHPSGGWDYGYDEASGRGGDLSISAWHVQALKACHHTGLDFRNMSNCIAEAMEFIIEHHDSGSGGFGYEGKGPAGGIGYHTLTGAGMLCLQMWGRGSAAQVRSGADYIKKNSRFDYNTEFCDLYGHYYESQAMMNRGAQEWEAYNAMFRDQVLNNQNPDGSWKTPGGGRGPRAVGAEFIGNAHYRTCLCILMLEVYYRFLPGTGGG